MGDRPNGSGSGGHDEPPIHHSITDWAAALGGQIGRDDDGELCIRAPGPGHSKDDHSLTVWLDPKAPQGFRVFSFSIRDDNFAPLRDYVAQTVGLPSWRPKAKANGHDKAHREVVAHYFYDDINGEPRQRVTRFAPKAFAQSRPDGNGGWVWGGIPDRDRVPFKLPEFTEAGSLGRTIFICEGEKAALALWAKGYAATCSSGGAGKWPEHFSKWFEGFTVVILADHDVPGRKHAEQVRENLEPAAASVRVINLPGLPDGGDVVDWMAKGGDPATIETLREGPPARGHLASELWDMPFPPVKYAVPGYIAEGLTLFAGAPKRGKSWLALDLCVTVANGGYTLGDQKCIQGDALYAALEDSPRRIKDRLRKVCQLAKRAPERLTVWFGQDLPRLGQGCEEALEEWLQAQEHPRLIVIDTLNYVRPERTRDEDPYSYDYRSATTLQRLASKYGVAIIVIHHTRKSPADDYLESVSGSNGLTGGSDAVMVLAQGMEGGFVLKGRGRDTEEFELAVKFEKDACRWSVLGNADETRTSDTRGKIMRHMEEAGWFLTPGEIASQTGLRRSVVDQQLFKMLKAGQLVKVGRGKYGLPPEVHEGVREPGSPPFDDDE